MLLCGAGGSRLMFVVWDSGEESISIEIFIRKEISKIIQMNPALGTLLFLLSVKKGRQKNCALSLSCATASLSPQL